MLDARHVINAVTAIANRPPQQQLPVGMEGGRPMAAGNAAVVGNTSRGSSTTTASAGTAMKWSMESPHQQQQQATAKLLAPVEEISVHEEIAGGGGIREFGNGQRNGPLLGMEGGGVAQQPATNLPAQEAGEDCAYCRSLDCEIMFLQIELF
jgi:hypothetical protein